MSLTDVPQERLAVSGVIDATLLEQLGYRCAFVVIWVKADTAPAMAGFGTNVSTADAIELCEQTLQCLKELK